jgi:hypothetical protein
VRARSLSEADFPDFIVLLCGFATGFRGSLDR